MAKVQEEVFKDFAQKGLELSPGQKFYRIQDDNFDLYGVFYDNDAGRFLRIAESTLPYPFITGKLI